MTRPLFDTEFLHGIHDPGGEHHMVELGRPGWVLVTEELHLDSSFHDIDRNYGRLSDQGLGVIVRLNHGYGEMGTLPPSSLYAAFADKCRQFVEGSRGCKIWIIGNETNLANERPRVPDGGREPITPTLYASCFRLCRDRIHSVPGHADDQVVVSAVGPWNPETVYGGNPHGDWVQYFVDVLQLIGPDGCDGIALHTYTHQPDPALVDGDFFMTGSGDHFRHHQGEFRAYRDFMNAVPASMRTLPVYITETNQLVPWEDSNNGWVQRACAEITRWNETSGNQQIRSLLLYRWPTHANDPWHFNDKPGVIEGFRAAVAHGHRWRTVSEPTFRPVAVGFTARPANLRQAPGYRKPQPDVLMLVPTQEPVTVIAGPALADELTWWQVQAENQATGAPVTGWMAERTPAGAPLLVPTDTRALDRDLGEGARDIGDEQFAAGLLVPRRSPGFVGKHETDILPYIPLGAPVTRLAGPELADGVTWWLIEAAEDVTGGPARGWVAETLADGQPAFAPTVLGASAALPDADTRDLTPSFRAGQRVRVVADGLRMRASPGLAGPELARAASGTLLTVRQGPQDADGLSWWQLDGTIAGQALTGWMAQAGPDGGALLQSAEVAGGARLGLPVADSPGITQRFGENPQFYRKIKYRGVPLNGHHGIDFGVPVGTPLLATDDGTVMAAGWDSTGFGNHVKIRHAWGESLYAHLSRIDVPVGAAVARGAQLGLSGNTGLSTGPHLHFGLRLSPYSVTDGWGGFSDPEPLLDLGTRDMPAEDTSTRDGLLPELLMDLPGAVPP